MRKRMLIFIAACFYYSGLVKLARWRTRRSGQRLVVLNYHRATGGHLRRHLLYLRQHYRILHLEEALEAGRQAGYDWALTTRYGFNTPQSDPYLLRRIEVDVDQHGLVIAVETAGLWGFFSRLRWLPAIRKHFTNSR